MRFQYSILPPLFPVSQTFILRFSVHVVDVYEPPEAASANHYDALKSSALTASGRDLFTSFLSRPLLRHQQDHGPPAAPAPLNTTQGGLGRVM